MPDYGEESDPGVGKAKPIYQTLSEVTAERVEWLSPVGSRSAS